jgi:hypothetical protein
LKQPSRTRARLNLKQIQAESPTAERLRAALRRNRRDAWTSPFAASGAKPPPAAPPKRRA